MISKNNALIMLTTIFVGTFRAENVSNDAAKIAASNTALAEAIKSSTESQKILIKAIKTLAESTKASNAQCAAATETEMSLERYFAEKEETDYELLLDRYTQLCAIDNKKNKTRVGYCVNLFVLLKEKSQMISTNSKGKRTPMIHKRWSENDEQWNAMLPHNDIQPSS